jgi:hypothetical protein
MEHMGQKLLKGQAVSHHPSDGQGFDLPLFMKHLEATRLSIQMHDNMLANEFGRDILALEINADHAMSIHGCRSRCTPSSVVSQPSGSTTGGSSGKEASIGKAVCGGRLPQESP